MPDLSLDPYITGSSRIPQLDLGGDLPLRDAGVGARPGVGAAPVSDAAAAAAANRAARVAKYGEAAVAKMEAAGNMFRGGVGAVPPAPGIGTTAAPEGFLSRVAADVPTFARGARAIGRFGARFGGPLFLGGMAVSDVMHVANDPNASKGDVAQEGVDSATRLGGAALGARWGGFVPGPPLVKGAAAAIGGAAGYFAPNAVFAARDWWRNRGSTAHPTQAAPAAPVPAQVGAGAVPMGQSYPQLRDPSETGTTPANAPVTAMTAADVNGTALPANGTGAFVNRRTGAVTDLDSRGAPGFGAEPAAAGPQYPLGSAGDYVGSLMNIRSRMAAVGRSTALAKMNLEYGSKADAAAHSRAQAIQIDARLAAGQAHLREHPGDYMGYASIISSRTIQPATYATMPSMTGNDVITTNRATGAAEIQTPRRAAQQITMAQAVANAKKNGVYTSDAQVRAATLKNPAYKLID